MPNPEGWTSLNCVSRNSYNKLIYTSSDTLSLISHFSCPKPNRERHRSLCELHFNRINSISVVKKFSSGLCLVDGHLRTNREYNPSSIQFVYFYFVHSEWRAENIAQFRCLCSLFLSQFRWKNWVNTKCVRFLFLSNHLVAASSGYFIT